jgi:hypothetical protein
VFEKLVKETFMKKSYLLLLVCLVALSGMHLPAESSLPSIESDRNGGLILRGAGINQAINVPAQGMQSHLLNLPSTRVLAQTERTPAGFLLRLMNEVEPGRGFQLLVNGRALSVDGRGLVTLDFSKSGKLLRLTPSTVGQITYDGQLLTTATVPSSASAVSSPAQEKSIPLSEQKPLTELTVSQVVGTVTIGTPGGGEVVPAKQGDRVTARQEITTGAASRAQLLGPDGTTIRLGAMTAFAMPEKGRAADLRSGSVLFHSPTGKGGGTIRTAGASAAVTGTTIMVSATTNGGFKLSVLEGNAVATLPDGNRQTLNPGQLVFVVPGRGFSTVLTFDLAQQTQTSTLVGGFTEELPSLKKVEAEISRQDKMIKSGRGEKTDLAIDDARTQVDFQLVRITGSDNNPANSSTNYSSLTQYIEARRAVNSNVPVGQPLYLGFGRDFAPYFPNVAKQSSANETAAFYAANNITLAPGTYDVSGFGNVQNGVSYATNEYTLLGSTTFTGFSGSLALVAGNDFTIADGSTIANTGGQTSINILASRTGSGTLNNATFIGTKGGFNLNAQTLNQFSATQSGNYNLTFNNVSFNVGNVNGFGTDVEIRTSGQLGLNNVSYSGGMDRVEATGSTYFLQNNTHPGTGFQLTFDVIGSGWQSPIYGSPSGSNTIGFGTGNSITGFGSITNQSTLNSAFDAGYYSIKPYFSVSNGGNSLGDYLLRSKMNATVTGSVSSSLIHVGNTGAASFALANGTTQASTVWSKELYEFLGIYSQAATGETLNVFASRNIDVSAGALNLSSFGATKGWFWSKNDLNVLGNINETTGTSLGLLSTGGKVNIPNSTSITLTGTRELTIDSLGLDNPNQSVTYNTVTMTAGDDILINHGFRNDSATAANRNQSLWANRDLTIINCTFDVGTSKKVQFQTDRLLTIQNMTTANWDSNTLTQIKMVAQTIALENVVFPASSVVTFNTQLGIGSYVGGGANIAGHTNFRTGNQHGSTAINAQADITTVTGTGNFIFTANPSGQ